MFLCATLHLALWRAGVMRVGWLGVDEELEKVGVVMGEEESVGRVRLYSPAHSRPVVYERSAPENSSCSALWQDPPDCSPHKEPQLPEHYWLKERASEQSPSLAHPLLHPVHTHLPSLSFSLPLVSKLHPKTMHTTHQSKDGRCLWWGAVCKPHCKWAFSLSLPPSPHSH